MNGLIKDAVELTGAEVSEPPAITIGRSGQRITITPLSRAMPDAEEPWDRDALDSTISVEAGPFAGAFRATVWSHELAHLGRELRSLDDLVGGEGDVDLRFLDGKLDVSFRLTRLGHLSVDVAVRPVATDDLTLKFTIDADRTFLKSWAGQAETVVARFPPQV